MCLDECKIEVNLVILSFIASFYSVVMLCYLNYIIKFIF